MGPDGRHRASARGARTATLAGTASELVVGAGALAVAAVAGLAFVHRPWPNRVDTVGFRLLPSDSASRWAHDVVALGSLTALVVGVVGVFALGMVRDRVRAVACAAAPVLAVLIVQDLAKPLVGRHLGLTGPSSYPSGTVAAVASLATALTLVLPRVTRPIAALLGAATTALACAAVVVLRWHYPTDALGGVAVGFGAVLTVDALFHLPWALAGRHSGSTRVARPDHRPRLA
jgi:membrane-associated phospholipid phosphatase